MMVVSKQTRFFIILLFTFLFSLELSSQEKDLQSWNMIAISKKVNPKFTSSLTTIYRINDNVSKFNDVSFDWRVNMTMKNGFSTQLTFRNWTFRELKPVYFFWYDLKYLQNKEQYKWVNILRVHHGLDWVGKVQADFIRNRSHYFHKVGAKKILSPFIGYDLWFQFNDINRFTSIWMEVGTEYSMSNAKFRLNYRRIGYFNNVPGLRRNIIVTGIFIKL